MASLATAFQGHFLVSSMPGQAWIVQVRLCAGLAMHAGPLGPQALLAGAAELWYQTQLWGMHHNCRLQGPDHCTLACLPTPLPDALLAADQPLRPDACSQIMPSAHCQNLLMFVWLQEVATFTASCEKYVGTESGGMDQAISIMGQQGIAKLVEFNPVPPHTTTCSLHSCMQALHSRHCDCA